MNLKELEYLVALDEERHFHRAAERCFVSQPTLSGQLKKLEDELGILLVERSNRQVSMTEAGKRIADIVMKPGDALYVRAGVPHICETAADHSLHLFGQGQCVFRIGHLVLAYADFWRQDGPAPGHHLQSGGHEDIDQGALHRNPVRPLVPDLLSLS